METLPRKLDCGIGGYLGRSYSVKLLPDGILEYKSSDYGYANWKTELIKPNQELWGDFRIVLDQIGIWKWKEFYENNNVVDGTGWGIEIEYEDKAISSSGSNDYPKKGFNKLLKAIQFLLEGREFC